MIIEDGNLLGDALHKKNMQIFLNDLIGLNSKGFLSSILFGQRMKKFIEATPEDKRKIFESVFEIDFIEGAKLKAKEFKNDLDTTLKTLNSNNNIISNKIDNLKLNIM